MTNNDEEFRSVFDAALTAARKVHADPRVTAEALASVAILWWDAECEDGIEGLKAYLSGEDQQSTAEMFASLTASGLGGNA